jgi:hypothetical protein
VGADADLWLVAEDVPKAVTSVREIARGLSTTTLVYEAGFFPWFGELTTLFFTSDGALSLDIGVCSPEEVATANPGPHVHVVWGDKAMITEVGKAITDSAPDERLAHLTITIVKLRKAVQRKHFWNALAYLTQARNDLIAIVRAVVKPTGINYSRPEHSAEEWLEHTLQQELAATQATYNAADILRCSVAICHLARRIGYACSESEPFWHVLDGVTAGLISDQLRAVRTSS